MMTYSQKTKKKSKVRLFSQSSEKNGATRLLLMNLRGSLCLVFYVMDWKESSPQQKSSVSQFSCFSENKTILRQA